MHTHESLIVPAGLTWPLDPIQEASGTGPARQVQRAGRAGQEVISSRHGLERDATKQLLTRLNTLKKSLQARLLAGVTDFRRFQLNALLADVDRLIAEATAALATQAERVYATAADLGRSNAEDPLRAAQLTVEPGLPGMDRVLVDAAFGNTVDLLTPPMQQFGADVKQALRGVALAGDGRMEAIQRLRDKIGGQGFDNAQYRAERIIRTELGRTFNEATFQRLLSLAEQFPFLKKGWRATGDSRTRMGHREAGKKYQRGGGSIPLSQSFSVNVYDERNGKAPKLMGAVLLRFPVDPQAVPQGRLSAAATIMCRCNGFVDFDLADYAAHVKTQLQVVVPGGGAAPSSPAPAAPKVPRMPKPAKAKAVPGAPKPPKVKVPKPADVAPKAPAPTKIGPSGTPVSTALQLEAGFDRVKKALDMLDSVHGDGNLPRIPVGQMPARYRRRAAAGYLSGATSGDARAVYFTKKILQGAPNMTTFHEVGHFLDHKGIGGAITQAVPGKVFGSDLANTGGPVADAVKTLQDAIRNSPTMQRMKLWETANLPGSGYTSGDGTIPLGFERRVTHYLLSTHESFARAYAQYVAVKSGNAAALKELRAIQASSATALQPVPRDHRLNMNHVDAKPMPAKTWDYPWQWQDAEFKPIEDAMDHLFEVLGWRTKS